MGGLTSWARFCSKQAFLGVKWVMIWQVTAGALLQPDDWSPEVTNGKISSSPPLAKLLPNCPRPPRRSSPPSGHS